jgi:hypothetical protein
MVRPIRLSRDANGAPSERRSDNRSTENQKNPDRHSPFDATAGPHDRLTIDYIARMRGILC